MTTTTTTPHLENGGGGGGKSHASPTVATPLVPLGSLSPSLTAAKSPNNKDDDDDPTKNNTSTVMTTLNLLDPKNQRFSALDPNYNNVPTYPLRPSYKDFHSQLRPASRVVVFDGSPDDPYRPTNVPIYQTATFEQPSASEFGAYDYTRSGNPTRTALETQVAMLENAHAAFAFVSGMAALNATTRLMKAGDTIILGGDIYGGMHRLVSRITSTYGIKVRLVRTWDLGEVARALEDDPRVTLVHIETPSNPLMHITDIRALSTLLKTHASARGGKIYLSVDSTTMTPHLSQPLNHGAGIVIHSMTKFIGGHSDTMGGIVCVANESLAKRIAFFQNAEGTGLSPFDSFLFLRGIKTLAIRVQQAQSNAMHIASFLLRHPLPQHIYYAGLEPQREEMSANTQSAQDYKIHMGQARGGGSVLSFTTGSVETSRRVINALQIFKLTVSFGSCNSLCEMPSTLSHASIPTGERTFPEDLIRLSIGIEDVNDLLEDLQRAFSAALSTSTGTEDPHHHHHHPPSPSRGQSPGGVSIASAATTGSHTTTTTTTVGNATNGSSVLVRERSTMHTTDRTRPELPPITPSLPVRTQSPFGGSDHVWGAEESTEREEERVVQRTHTTELNNRLARLEKRSSVMLYSSFLFGLALGASAVALLSARKAGWRITFRMPVSIE